MTANRGAVHRVASHKTLYLNSVYHLFLTRKLDLVRHVLGSPVTEVVENRH